MTNDPTIDFPAISALKNGRQQYLTSWSMRTVLFCLSPHATNATDGSGLRLNPNVAAKIAATWTKNGEAPCIRPIVVAIRSDARFSPLATAPKTGLGTLQLPLGAILDVCDGVHRIAALEKAGFPSAILTKSTWPIHLIEVKDDHDLARLLHGVEKSRNVFARISQPSAVSNPQHALWIRNVIESSKFLNLAVAQEKSSLPTRSSKLWTGSAVRRAMQSLLNSSSVQPTMEMGIRIAESWDVLASAIPALDDYANGKITASELRETTVLPLASMIPPLAQVCAKIASAPPDSCATALQKITAVDWSQADGGWAMLHPSPIRKEVWIKKLLEQTGLAAKNS